MAYPYDNDFRFNIQIKQPQYAYNPVIVEVQETDNPADLGYFEWDVNTDTYIPTSDISPVLEKEYYAITESVTWVFVPSSKFYLDEYLDENGIDFGSVNRREVSIITMNGTVRKKAIVKKTVSFKFVDLNDAAIFSIGRIFDTSEPIQLLYTDKNGVRHTDENFYVQPYSLPVQKVEAGIAYYSGLSITLEEK